MKIALTSTKPTLPGYYVIQFPGGGPHLVLIQKEIDGVLTVHFDGGATIFLSHKNLSATVWSEKINFV